MRVPILGLCALLTGGCFDLPAPPRAAAPTDATADAATDAGADGIVGDLGDTPDADADVVPLVEHPAVAIACGGPNACALDADGRMYCWGHADTLAGLGGFGEHDAAPPTLARPDRRFTAIVAGARWAGGVTDAGLVVTWGATYGTRESGNSRTYPVVGDVTLAATSHTLLVRDDVGLHSAGARIDGQAWESPADGDVDDGSLYTISATPPPGRLLAVGRWFACTSASKDVPECWGVGRDGRLGDGTLTTRTTPAAVDWSPTNAVAHLAAGADHACLVTAAGAALWCWGSNAAGQLGAAPSTLSAAVRPRRVEHDLPAPIADVALGEDHTCALLTDRSVHCWGDNRHGQLGVDGITQAWQPRRADVGPATALCARAGLTCALLRDGVVACWGDNSAGQLGSGVPGNPLNPTPRRIELPAVEDVERAR